MAQGDRINNAASQEVKAKGNVGKPMPVGEVLDACLVEDSAGLPAIKTLDDNAGSLPGFNIPPYDEIDITYVGATEDIDTVVYKNGGVPVATLTLSYDGNNRLNNVTRT